MIIKGFSGIAIAAALLAGGSSAQPSAATSYPGTNGLIAFVRSNQIYTISPTGSGLKQLTTGDKNYDPVWNPSGTEIAYEHEYPAGVRNIWVMKANGSDKRQWTTTGKSYGTSAWSPNGSTLLFTNGGPYGTLMTTSGAKPKQALKTLYGYNENAVPNPTYGPLSGNNPSWTTGYIAFVGSNGAGGCDTPEGSSTFGEGCIEAYQTGSHQYSEIATSGCASAGSGADYLTVDWPRWYPSANTADVVYQYNTEDDSGSCSPTAWQVTDQAGLGVIYGTIAGDQQPDFSPDGTEMVVMNNLNSTSTPYIVVIDVNGNRDAITTGYQPNWQPVA